MPVVKNTIERYGNYRLEEYLQLLAASSSASYQPSDDLGEAVYQYAAPLLGESVAQQARSDLKQSPFVLTANHHGVDYFAQSVQSTLLFGLRGKFDGVAPQTVPVLACGNVPLDNLTYPRGALLYHNGDEAVGLPPMKLPLFPDRLKRKMVSQVSGFDLEMLNRIKKTIRQAEQKTQGITHQLKVLSDLIESDYGAGDVVNLERYSDQAVIINQKIWKQLFLPDFKAADLLYLELERVAAMLLEADIEDRNSLAYSCLFNSEVRNALLKGLDQVSGCWNYVGLNKRWTFRHQIRNLSQPQCGTFLFWGIDQNGGKIPLLPVAGKTGGVALRGVCDRGEEWEVNLEPIEIQEGIRDGRLLPSVFTCMLVLVFARGVNCAGGYYQGDYLLLIQRGIASALQHDRGLEGMKSMVELAPTSSYLSGMQAVMGTAAKDGLVPIGPVEIMTSGGLSNDDVQQIGNLSVLDAHVASLHETLPDVAADFLSDRGDWWRELAVECNKLLRGKVVVKDGFQGANEFRKI
ncbi:hypothetical protein [Motiliproteus sp. MSK22-1]|uniref:hypothetical protein n=1 Tax=Motiliproteus sp. MSK22-1 TaxID=1897630 RepID=UPI0009777199|nr:hypothetical protein [Motiliproteus sp. MSK22-1]OMH32748.1 hypothetical protein BGP75_14580 [Motiliproteus sp. MSK22-1]